MSKSVLSRASAFASGALFALWALFPVVSSAGVDEAFDNLLKSSTNASISEPGRFSSQARNSFVAGGADIRFPNRETPALISVTPVTFNAGCGGVSAFFGGFSFINGDEIKQMIQSVAQNSVGVAIELVMTTLCGPCAHVMQVMRSLAKDAARLSIDSCQVAQNLINRDSMTKLTGLDFGKPEKQRAVCSTSSTGEGAVSDYMKAMNDVCEGTNKAAEYMEDLVNRKLGAAGIDKNSPLAASIKCGAGVSCNSVWTLLNQTNLKGADADNIRAKLIIMNVIGTNVYCPTNDACGIKPEVDNSGSGYRDETKVTRVDNNTVFYPPQLGNVAGKEGVNMQDVFDLFMCGTNWAAASAGNSMIKNVVEQYCTRPSGKDGTRVDADGNSLAKRPVWDCDGASPLAGGYDTCLSLVKRETGMSTLAGNGYLPKVLLTLQKGVDAVRTNTDMPPDVIALIQLSPVPLYQAINAAAVYPDAGGELVSILGTYTAQLMVYADLRDMIRQAEVVDKSVQLTDADMDRLYAFLGGMRASMIEAQRQLSQQATMQESLMRQIKTLNIMIQKEVMTEELLGPARFSTAVTGAASDAVDGSTGGETP